MPAYNFKEQFVDFVLDGSKQQTIRARRKNFAKKGDILYLYSGLRTKYAKKLREERCTDTQSIFVSDKDGIILYDGLLEMVDMEIAKENPFHELLPVSLLLDYKELQEFAWKDGFRPYGSTLQNPGNAFGLMLMFWRKTHSFPWVGDVIYWKAQTPALYGKAL